MSETATVGQTATCPPEVDCTEDPNPTATTTGLGRPRTVMIHGVVEGDHLMVVGEGTIL